MTKETKIGLLVGLAFIILFAIILSEKGTTGRDASPPAFTLADASKNNPRQTGTEGPLHDAGRLPIESTLSPITGGKTETTDEPEMSEEPIGQPVPAAGQPMEPLPESVVAMLNLPGNGADEASGEVQTPDDDAGEAPDEESGPADDSPTLTETLVASADEAESAHEAPDSTLPEPMGSARSAQTTAKKPDKPLPIKAIHTVQPGESIGKIAARYYGRATPARIEAIFNANRDVLKSIHYVRASDPLNIPELTEFGSGFEPAPGFPVAEIAAAHARPMDGQVRIPEPIAESVAAAGLGAKDKRDDRKTGTSGKPRTETEAFRWYEIKKKDTLSRIARRELGSERLYLEIYRLNRDKIADQNRIRPGLMIRLPLGREASAARTTRVAGGGDIAEP